MCGGPAWKREKVPDHKFDFVDTRDFTDNGFMMRIKYLWVYIIVLKSFLVYLSDISTAVTMLTVTTAKASSNPIFAECGDTPQCVAVPFDVTKWLFVGCIIFSFLLLAYESRKARKIIISRDISYAFTNVMANNYYSLRSYDHFCFFDHISNSTKKKDDFAFFIFFTFKSWKRLLLADGPRQSINALTLWRIYLSRKTADPGDWWDVTRYFPHGQKLAISALTLTTFFTVLVFIGSLLLLIAAGIFYIPLLCYIQGNLKEYVCHIVDKRISQVIKRRNKERLAKAAELAKKEAMGDFSHLKNKKGELIAQPLPQPTLPSLSVDDDPDDTSSMRTRVAQSNYTQDYYYGSDYKTDGDYPPMPGYQQGYTPYDMSQPQYDMSQPQYGMYEDDSQVNLTSAAAPFAQHAMIERPGSAQPSPGLPLANPHSYYDPHDVYSGRGSPAPVQPQPQRGLSADSGRGLAYDDPYSVHSQSPYAGYYQGDVEHGRR